MGEGVARPPSVVDHFMNLKGSRVWEKKKKPWYKLQREKKEKKNSMIVKEDPS